jgi:predicted Zn-dependent protease
MHLRGFVLFLCSLPLAGQQGVNFYSLEKERALGQRLASEVKFQSKPFANAAVDAYVQRVGTELIGQLKEVTFEYQFEVISGGTWTEPFPVPGGFIFVPAHAFVAAQDEAEFVALLAHAIGHAAQRHGTRSATRGEIVNMASIPVVFMGSWSGPHTASQASQALIPLGFLNFQRLQELEADRFGLELAARTGYDPAAFERYVRRTQRADSKLSGLPERELRLGKIQETIAGLPRAATPWRASEEFRSVQETVRSILGQPSDKRAPTLQR